MIILQNQTIMLEDDVMKSIKETSPSTDRKVLRQSFRDLEDIGFLKISTMPLSDWFVNLPEFRILYTCDCDDPEKRYNEFKRKVFFDICRKGITYSLTNNEDDRDKSWKQSKVLDRFTQKLSRDHARPKIANLISFHEYLMQASTLTPLRNLLSSESFTLKDIFASITIRLLIKLLGFPSFENIGIDSTKSSFGIAITYSGFFSNVSFFDYFILLKDVDNDFASTLMNCFVQSFSFILVIFVIEDLVEVEVPSSSMDDDVHYVSLLSGLHLPIASLSFKWSQKVFKDQNFVSCTYFNTLWQDRLLPKLRSKENLSKLSGGQACLMKSAFGEDESSWPSKLDAEFPQECPDNPSEEKKRTRTDTTDALPFSKKIILSNTGTRRAEDVSGYIDHTFKNSAKIQSKLLPLNYASRFY
jgi:hypothetical protein